jgi:predicted amidohydrolase YtcJ
MKKVLFPAFQILVAGAALLILQGPAEAETTEADTVLKNAKIYTADTANPWAKSIAISDGNIVYVGDNDGAQAFVGATTRVGDLGGRVILPGIVSTHEHPLLFMGCSQGLMMENRGDRDYMMEELKKYVATHPDGPFFSFGGAYEGAVVIKKEDIDAIIADKPFVMVAASGHGGWMNTKALEAMDIVPGKPDPIDYFERDDNGVPTGYVGTSAAIFSTIVRAGLIDKDSILAGAPATLALLSSYGITTAYDAGVTMGLEGSAFEAAHELEKRGDLTTRIAASAAFAQRPVHIKPAIAAMDKYKPLYDSEVFKTQTLKIHGDGDWGGYTVGVLEPLEGRPDSLGMVSFPEQEQLNSFLLEAAKRGFDIHVHVGGDRTARMVLNGFEAVRAAGFEDTRLVMGHTMLVHPDDKPRFKELDVIVNTFATGISVHSDLWKQQVGEERYELLMPMGSFADDGVRVVLSADWPTADIDPFLQIYTAMTRKERGAKKSMPTKKERLTLEQALDAYTVNAAYALRMEDLVGSLEVGKKADLIVLDRDIFKIKTDEIPEVNVLVTMMNGRIVHEEALDWTAEKSAGEELIGKIDACNDEVPGHSEGH